MSNGINLLNEKPQWFKLRVLTPLHVGTDKSKHWQEGIDFRYEENKIYKGDLDVFLRHNPHYIPNVVIELQKGRNAKLPSQVLKGAHATVVSAFPSSCSAGLTSNGISPVIRTGVGQPYLPGSSLKGALAAMLVAATNPSKKRDAFGNPNDPKPNDPKKDVLGGIEDSLMRFIRTSDVTMPARTIIVPSKIMSLRDEQQQGAWEAGWKHDRNGSITKLNPGAFMTAYEVFPSGTIGCGNIRIMPELLGWVRKQEKAPNIAMHSVTEAKDNKQAFDLLCKIINQNTKRYLEAELKYYQKFDEHEYAEDLVEAIHALIAKLPTDGENRVVMQFGRNVGFHRITGDWQYPNEHVKHTISKVNLGVRKPDHPDNAHKTRKWALLGNGSPWRFAPFGFVELTWVSEEEGRALQAELLAEGQAPATLGKLETSPAAPPEPPKPTGPVALKGKPKKGDIPDATLLKQEGAIAILKLHYTEDENAVAFLRYPDLPADKVHTVTLTDFDRTSARWRCTYKRAK